MGERERKEGNEQLREIEINRGGGGRFINSKK